jgi:hypothetical protein
MIADYGDEFSHRAIEQATARGHVMIARYHSRFEALPPSTLQVYIDAGGVLFRCKN